jgi:hypothetical protein
MLKHAFLVILISAAGAAGAHAQAIGGAVVSTGDGMPLAGVLVRVTGLADVEATAVTDSAGRFMLLLPREGVYHVTADRIGLRQLAPARVELRGRTAVEVTITMDPLAIELTRLIATARSRMPTQTELINERIRSARALGLGRTMTLEEVEARNAPDITALLSTAAPGLEILHRDLRKPDEDVVMLRRGGCIPAIYIDGVRFNRRPRNVNYEVQPHELLGVEVYQGAGQMRDYFDPTGCGTILLWTKRGEEQGPSRVSWKRIGIAFGLVSLLLIVC